MHSSIDVQGIGEWDSARRTTNRGVGRVKVTRTGKSVGKGGWKATETLLCFSVRR